MILLIKQIAYVLFGPTAKSGRRCRLRRGPNVVGPLACLQSSRSHQNSCTEPNLRPAPNKGVVMLATLVTLRAGALAGGDTGQCNWGDRPTFKRRVVYFRDLPTNGIRRHHGVGSKSKYPFLGR